MSWTIAKIASVVLCAMGSGLCLSSFGYAPVLGYIIAGIILGPSGFKFIEDQASVNVASELGITLLLFVIGLELSLDKIKNIWRKSVLITTISLILIICFSAIAGHILDLTLGQILLVAFCVTLSSTAVTVKTMKLLPNLGENISENLFGILIVQDIFALIMVLIINMFGTKGFSVGSLYKGVMIAIFLLLVTLYVAKYPKKIYSIANFLKKHSDMMSIIIFGMCLGGAVLAELAGLSASFGAFIMGLILGNSTLVEDAKSFAEPIEELFLMTFFLSVGLMVDLGFIWLNFGLMLLALIAIAIGKTLINIFTLRICQFPLRDSFVISVLLGHIGEFSFMLVYTALRTNIVDIYGVHFLVSLTALSLFISPFWVSFAEKCRIIASRHASVSSSWEFFKLVSRDEWNKICPLFDFIKSRKQKIEILGYEKESDDK